MPDPERSKQIGEFLEGKFRTWGGGGKRNGYYHMYLSNVPRIDLISWADIRNGTDIIGIGSRSSEGIKLLRKNKTIIESYGLTKHGEEGKKDNLSFRKEFQPLPDGAIDPTLKIFTARIIQDALPKILGSEIPEADLVPITDSTEIRACFEIMASTLKLRAMAFEKKVGWRGGGDTFTVFWRKDEGIWSLLEPDLYSNRYWCCYGTDDPNISDNLSIACEVNPPRAGIDHRVAGAFLRDKKGSVFLCHNGNIGGGRKGIGKKSFLRQYAGENIVTPQWSDGVRDQVILIGRIDTPEFPTELAEFIRVVEYFKSSPSADSASSQPRTNPSFNPEFSGTRQPYERHGTVESQCHHGLVVSALQRQLSNKGFQVGNDQARDLYIVKKGRRVSHLFEVKTDRSTPYIYAGIGQLIFHGATQHPAPKRILVLPDRPNRRTMNVLRRLKIAVTTFTITQGKVVFSGLSRVI